MIPITKSQAKKEAAKALSTTIPYFVIEVFNDLIVENLGTNTATFTQEKVVARITKKMKELGLPGSEDTQRFFKEKWLDVEPLFRKKGWKVVFDKPGYCETYAAKFTFS